MVPMPYIQRKIGLRPCLLFGSALIGLALIFCSLMKSVVSFISFYSSMIGMGVGIVSIGSSWPCWDWFPNSKGLITGIILSGYALGSVLITLVATLLINP